MHVNELAKLIRDDNATKGFDPTEGGVERYLLLAVAEITEAQEELRDGRAPVAIYHDGCGYPYHAGSDLTGFPKDLKPEGFPVEIADAIIRLLDIAAKFKIDIEAVIQLKLAYNRTRPSKHGRKF